MECSATPQRSKIVTYFIYSEASETNSGWINVDLLECNPMLLNRSYQIRTFYVYNGLLITEWNLRENNINDYVMASALAWEQPV